MLRHRPSAPDSDARSGARGGGAGTWRRRVERLLRWLPLLACLGWLVSFVARYGPAGHGTEIIRSGFIAVAISLAVAVASGAYEHTRAFAWLRERRGRRGIDWSEFDRMRERWERGRRGGH